MKAEKIDLRKQDAQRVQTAATLLEMGKPRRALAKLQRLTQGAWKHPWSESVLWRAAQYLS
jgi:hypothetical protein